MTTASDNFNRAAESPLGPPWISVTDLSGGANTDGSVVTSAFGISIYAGTWGDNQWVQGIVGNLSAGTRYAILCVRYASDGRSLGYEVHTDGVVGAGNTFIAKRIQGSVESIHVMGSSFSNGDLMRFGAVGNTLTVYKNGAEIGSVVDSAYPTGNPGVGSNADGTIDDWLASDGEDSVKAKRMVGWKYSR